MTILELCEGILASFRSTYPDLKTAGMFAASTDVNSIQLPAVLLSLKEMKRNSDTGTNELDVSIMWEAHVMGNPDQENGKTSQEIGLRLAYGVEGNNFGFAMQGAKFLQAAESEEVTLKDKVPWAVSFEQRARFAFDEPDAFVLPEDVYLSMAPEIGLAHKGDYTLVHGGDE